MRRGRGDNYRVEGICCRTFVRLLPTTLTLPSPWEGEGIHVATLP